MAGFQIPIETKIDFLVNIVIPFFDETPAPQNRKDWMTENAENLYGVYLKTLIRSTNIIKSLQEAKEELAKAKEELAKAKEEFKRDKERADRAAERAAEREFILQQQRAGTLYLNLCSSYFFLSSFLLNY
jgi:hypothetical protein